MHKYTLKCLRLLGIIFIWLGLAIGILDLAPVIPNVVSFTGLLMTLAGTIELMARTAGLGALLLLLAEIVELLSKPR
jgi:hypothetical protein